MIWTLKELGLRLGSRSSLTRYVAGICAPTPNLPKLWKISDYLEESEMLPTVRDADWTTLVSQYRQAGVRHKPVQVLRRIPGWSN